MITPVETGTPSMLAHVDGNVGWMTYRNPARLNAVSQEMQEAIPRILAQFSATPELRVVVVRGDGHRAFVSGADIAEFADKRTSVEARAAYDGAVMAVSTAYAHFEWPVIAMVRGYCLGFGLLAAVQADIRIAAEDGQFGIPAARLGLGYQYWGVELLAGLVGPAYAAEILFSGRRLSAEEALRIGLVNRVVPAAELETTARELADTIASNAPLTVKAAKAAVSAFRRGPSAQDLAAIDALVEACYRSDDYREGQRAFAEKREPRFEGR